MSGPEMARRLASVRPGARVLFISGHTPDGAGRDAVLDEGVVYVKKPFTPAALAHAVRRALDAPPGPDEPA
jgi:FixJ family two-component response regulator